MADIEPKSISPLEGEGIRGDGQARWYVIHTYSGHEDKIKNKIMKMVENRGMQDLIMDVVVPTEEEYVTSKDGQLKRKSRKKFPGYAIVKMIVTNESWYLVRNTQGVTGFVGNGSNPSPLSDDEVAKMGIERVYVDLEVGETIEVIRGPFENFMGVVEGIKQGNDGEQVIKVRIQMMGRDTSIELSHGEVRKV